VSFYVRACWQIFEIALQYKYYICSYKFFHCLIFPFKLWGWHIPSFLIYNSLPFTLMHTTLSLLSLPSSFHFHSSSQWTDWWMQLDGNISLCLTLCLVFRDSWSYIIYLTSVSFLLPVYHSNILITCPCRKICHHVSPCSVCSSTILMLTFIIAYYHHWSVVVAAFSMHCCPPLSIS
jgi:hypothetical protein